MFPQLLSSPYASSLVRPSSSSSVPAGNTDCNVLLLHLLCLDCVRHVVAMTGVFHGRDARATPATVREEFDLLLRQARRLGRGFLRLEAGRFAAGEFFDFL